MGMRKVDGNEKCYSDPPRLTYRKGVLICSGGAGFGDPNCKRNGNQNGPGSSGGRDRAIGSSTGQKSLTFSSHSPVDKLNPSETALEGRLMTSVNLKQQSYNDLYNQHKGHSANENNMNNNNNRTDSHYHPPPKEFIPSFVLVDACKANNERKIRQLVGKLIHFGPEDVDPVVNFQDSTGRTALSYACASGNVLLVDQLSKLRRLDPNLDDNENNAPLHYASQAGHSEVVDLLLTRFEGVVDPNCRNSTGLTPLMKAALQGRTRCAKSLISAGASANLRDYSRNLTAAEWAKLCGRHITSEVILRCAKDNYQNPYSPTSPSSDYSHNHRHFPVSHSAMELKKISNSEDSPYYHLYAARSTISGTTWLKNKIKKALGSSSSGGGTTNGIQNSNNSLGGGRKPESFALLANLTGPTLCAGSIFPNLKPLLEQQSMGRKLSSIKMTIPTLQVTPVGKR